MQFRFASGASGFSLFGFRKIGFFRKYAQVVESTVPLERRIFIPGGGQIPWPCNFVPQFFPQGFETVEFLDGAAVLAFGLGLVAQQQGKTVVLADQAVEAIAEQVVAVLGLADFDFRGELRVHGHAELPAGVEGLAQA